MSNTVAGEVEFVNKNQKSGFYSAKIGGAWFGCTKEAPPFKKGDVIKFESTERNGYQNLVVDSVEIVDAAPKSDVKSEHQSRLSKDDYFRNKVESDIVQQHIRELHAARANAVEIVNVLLAAGAIKLPSADNKKYEAVLGYISELTESLYKETQSRFYGTEEVKSNIDEDE